MLFQATPVRPVSPEVRAGLVLSWEDVRKTGSTRCGRPEYEILRRLWYRDYEVEKGFIFDIHSLPRPLRPWQPRNPEWWGAAAFHDRLLEGGSVPIKEANQVYLQAMRDLGVNPIHRAVAFSGVEFARLAFPERIRRIDPDNADLIARVEGRQAVYDESGPAIRKAVYLAARATVGGYLRSKGVMLP